MLEQFQVASGSFIGRDHSLPLVGKNNQDSFRVVTTENSITAVVCDGCGSSSSSEVGAKVAANFLAEAVTSLLYRCRYDQMIPLLNRAGEELLAQVRLLAKSFGGSFTQAVTDNFLFTVVGVHMTQSWTLFFSIGDGVVVWNGNPIKIGPFENNEPPYIAYRLIDSKVDPELVQFQTQLIPTVKIDSFLIGSDGVGDLIARENCNVPGKSSLVGPISQFWQDDSYFTNTDKVRRRLALLNNEHVSVDWDGKIVRREPGLLPDDTTLVVIRRKKVDS